MTAPKLQDRKNLPGHILHFEGEQDALVLDSGQRLEAYSIAYQTYGTLNAAKSNAVMICHALTGDQFVAERHPVTGKDGWWDNLVGAGKVVDTDRYFVICSNILGGCMGSTGPSSMKPDGSGVWGIDFPVITIGDMVKAQKKLVDALGIGKLFAVIGGSMGGMQTLAWASLYPDMMHAVLPIATAPRHSAQNIAFHEVGRQSVMADPDWNGGTYAVEAQPRRGLSVARMVAHITYLSESALHRKFGRSLQNREGLSFGFDADFQVESYLRHQGSSFVDRFDANSYLYITRAMDYFDLAAEHDGSLAKAFSATNAAFCVVSFSSDWLFPTSESRDIVHSLNAGGKNVSFIEIQSDKGHDAFLLDEPEFYEVLDGFLKGRAARLGLFGDFYEPAAQDAAHSAPDIAHMAAQPAISPKEMRVDFQIIGDMVRENARILDIGCGEGDLLAYLAITKKAAGFGLELSLDGVRSAVGHGLSVIQGDANIDLHYYGERTYDYAILSHTLQAMDNPAETLNRLLNIGKEVIVSFPNFGHWRVRSHLMFGGRMPVNETIPYSWWETPNIHFCTIRDFEALCGDLGATIVQRMTIDSQGQKTDHRFGGRLNNLLGEQAVYLLSR